MPNVIDDASRAAEDRWATRQLDLLHCVAAGESTFRASPRSAGETGEYFDDRVEHELALSRRGPVTCDTPILDIEGRTRYAVVISVTLPSAGRWTSDRIVRRSLGHGQRVPT